MVGERVVVVEVKAGLAQTLRSMVFAVVARRRSGGRGGGEGRVEVEVVGHICGGHVGGRGVDDEARAVARLLHQKHFGGFRGTFPGMSHFRTVIVARLHPSIVLSNIPQFASTQAAVPRPFQDGPEIGRAHV